MGRIGALVLAATLAISVLGPMRSGLAGRCEPATLEEARMLAERAAALLEAEGPLRSFSQFADPDGGFIDRDLYVFVIDVAGRSWFNAVFPVQPGSNLRGSRDRHGRFFVEDMLLIAKTSGSGWVEYEWYSPCSGEMEPKSAYIIRVGPLIVGVGAYGTMAL